MDSLELNLSQLKILSKNSITYKSNNDIKSSNSYIPFEDEEINGKICKKIGPAIPPKPVKDIPQVPQSCTVRKTCEPLYAKSLQNINIVSENTSEKSSVSLTNNSNDADKILFHKEKNSSTDSLEYSENKINNVPILLRKQPAYERQFHVYSNIKMTLDNPAILDQQLEALEHHKKQLEKRGDLTAVNKLVIGGPKLSSASYINGELAAAVRSSPSVKMMAAKIKENKEKITKKSTDEQSLNSFVTSTSKTSHIETNMKNSKSGNTKTQKTPKTKRLGKDDRNIYTNISYNSDILPPPPIIDEQFSNLESSKTESYLNCSSQQQPNTEAEEEFPLPPSPVSSSYSELRRATDYYPQIRTNPLTGYKDDLDNIVQFKENTYINTTYNDYNSYGAHATQSLNHSSPISDYYGLDNTCQGSSTYESIYEPITINTGQILSKPNFSTYVSCENNVIRSTTISSSGNISNNGTSFNNNCAPKEKETQNYADLITNSLDSSNESDSYGSCIKCGKRVVNENSGCTAMDQIYHISCFTCTQCQINLQGKPFYGLESKPYCEEDYLNTLEKCSVCVKPILERILRATGKPYHPQCFTCIICGASLDGIPFTVDATNQNYCIQDFHKKFAPRCCVCREPIMPDPGQEETVRVVALDRSFHFECYKCEDCGLLLSSESEGRGCYPLDDHVLCKSCNAKRVQVLTNPLGIER